ncbi:MAG TPA: ABC transporter permease subunit [Solirubrobacteraceae bacterium]|jgi:phosphate transport system permease protein|nr:ABC transporter permease subunit [Solirubrobacteraceae bacterium]
MSGALASPPAAPPPGDAPSPARRSAADSSASWRLTDRLGLAFAWFLGLLFCAITAAIVIFLALQGIRYLHPDLIWTNPQVGFNQSETGGFLAELIGTALVAGIAIAIAGPVGVGVAVWLSEYARPAGLARVVESSVEMLAGAPSVVLALFGILVFERKALGFLSETNGGVVFGKSFFAAGAMLSLVALPLVVTTVREGLQAIPNHVREASYAVGKTKRATIRRVLLPAARPSVITGHMLGIGHVIGDTAIIVLLLGDTQSLQGVGHIPLLGFLQGTGSTLTSYVFDNAPTGDLNQPNKAYAAAFMLLLLVLALNVMVDIFGRRSKELLWT